MVTKSIGPCPHEGHPGPCFCEVPGGIINAMGLPNPSREFIPELEVLQDRSVIASVFGGNPAEFREVASWFTGRVSAVELNLSCPHAEGYGAAIGSDPAMVEACTRAVKSLGMPVWVKLTPNVTDVTECGRAAERGGADAIVAINTVKAMRISTELRRPVLGKPLRRIVRPRNIPCCGAVRVRAVRSLPYPCDRLRGDIHGPGCRGDDNGGRERCSDRKSAVIGDTEIFGTIRDTLYSPDGISAEEIRGCAHG